MTAYEATTKLARKNPKLVQLQIRDVASSSRLYAPLRLHQSWVTDIQFSHDNIHMVTVGDKIAWWCLDHLPRKKSNSNVFNQRQGRRVSVPTLDTYNPFQ